LPLECAAVIEILLLFEGSEVIVVESEFLAALKSILSKPPLRVLPTFEE
jgi:hypothetical protein